MIEVTGVTKTYPAQGSEVRAVDDVKLEVKPGEFILILGRSGSGKSTLLGMLAGLIRPTTGSIRFNGNEIWTLSEAGIAELRAKEIGFVFQFSGLIPTITALENVMLPTLFCPNGSGSRSKALALIETGRDVTPGRCLSQNLIQRRNETGGDSPGIDKWSLAYYC